MSYFKAIGTKFDFGWGSAPDPDGELTVSLGGFKGPTSNGRGGAKGKGKKKGRGGGEKRRAMSLPPPIRTKFTRAYGGAEVRERRGQGREQWQI